jgi:hypothetical protein
MIVWASDGGSGQHFLAVFNLGVTPMRIDRSVDAISSTAGIAPGKFMVREIWSGKAAQPSSGAIDLTIPAHGCVLLQLQK